MRISFLKRNFTEELLLPNLDFVVEKYSKAAMGGPKAASIRVKGNDLDLWQLITMVRCPVKIYTDQGDAVWWGFLGDVSLTARNPLSTKPVPVKAGVSIDTMRNRIAVAYTQIDITTGDMTTATTSWLDDAFSQAEYGTYELLWTRDGATQTHAEAARAMKLSLTKYPLPVIQLAASGDEIGASLTLRGWWETLGWKYYANPSTTSVDTSDQVVAMMTAKGQFFSAIDQDVTSGLSISEYKDGDGSALFETQQLLEMGTTNYRRMLVELNEHRRVRIYEEPAKPVDPYLLLADGSLHDSLDAPVRKATCPAAFWARHKDIIPESVDTGLLADPGMVFVEEMEYDVENDRLQYIAREAPDPWDFPIVKDG